jgi:hypothetical protein
MTSDLKNKKEEENKNFHKKQREILNEQQKIGAPTLYLSVTNPDEYELEKTQIRDELKIHNFNYDKLMDIIVELLIKNQALGLELSLLRKLIHVKDDHAHKSNSIEKELAGAGAKKRASRYEPDNKTYENVFHSMCLNDYKMPTRESYLSELESTPPKVKRKTKDKGNPDTEWSESTASRKWRLLKEKGHL